VAVFLEHCVYVSLCTTVTRNTSHNSSDNLPLGNHHCSGVVYQSREGAELVNNATIFRLEEVSFTIPSWKPDIPFHETPDMQMKQDFCMLMPPVVLHKIHFRPMAYVDEDSLVDFRTVHIPQLLELVLKYD